MKFQLAVNLERLDNSLSMDEVARHTLEMVQMAEDGGFNIVWAAEHHALEMTIAPNPFQILTWWASETSKVRLGTAVVNAAYWHPIRLAGEAAFLDLISGGRLEFGLGSGAYQREFDRMHPGLLQTDGYKYMQEMLPAVLALWKGDYAHDGKYFQFPSTTSIPKPLQDNGPPIWIAARDPNSHEFAIANDWDVQVTPLWKGFDEIERLKNIFDDICTKYSDKPKPLSMVLNHCYIGSNDDDTHKGAVAVSKFYNNFGAWFKNNRSVIQGTMDPLTQEELDNNEMCSPNEMKKNQNIGTLNEVIDNIKRYEDLGFDEYSIWIDSHLSIEDKKVFLDRFISDVMPRFK